MGIIFENEEYERLSEQADNLTAQFLSDLAKMNLNKKDGEKHSIACAAIGRILAVIISGEPDFEMREIMIGCVNENYSMQRRHCELGELVIDREAGRA